VLIGGLCVALALEMIIRLARARMVAWNGACYEHRTACAAMDHMLGSDLGRFQARGIGAHLSGLSAIGRLKDFANGQSLITLFELALLPVYIALMAYIAGALVLVPLAVLAVFTVFALWSGLHLKKALQGRDNADDRRYDFLVESLEGVHTLKSFALEERFQRRYESLERDSTRASYDVTEDSARIFNMSTVFSHIMLVAVIAVGALDVMAGTISSGALIATVLLSGRIMQPVQRTVGMWVRFQDYRVAKAKLQNIMDLPQVRMSTSYTKPERRGSIDVKNVAFRYDDAKPDLFQHVSLSVGRGESVRISGAHGVGKTVLLHMIAGLYAPTAGDILVDGLAPLDYPPSERIRHVAMLRTQGVIFHGTIRDNITRFGAVPEAQAREVSSLLGIDQDVSALARGFDTMLEGTETDIIPPGLRQRIAIARALASKPRVILFDNADRNLDRDGYRQVYRLLGRLREKVALILVSDDRNIIRLADRHYNLTAEGLQPVDTTSGSSFMYGSLRA
ncbi:MAG: ATP-binding cassette domain-containing protein, partial [Alphaproteobacteria bacterium]|nr:ATP-binding cassette domain-containing protein [Alphaproteobacteria bacterium]